VTQSKRKIYLYHLIDFFIYALTFLVLFFSLESKISLFDTYLSYFLLYLLSGAVSSLITQKFSFEENDYTYSRVFYSFILMLGIISSYSFFVRAIDVPRFITLSSLFVSFIIEILWIRIFVTHNKISIRKSRIIPSRKVLIFGFVLFSLSGYAFFRDHFSFNYVGLQHLYVAGIYISWFISIKLTFNFHLNRNGGYWRFIWAHIKSYVLLTAMVLFLLFILKFGGEINTIAISGILKYVIVSFLSYTYYFLSKNQNQTDEVAPDIFKAPLLNINEFEDKLNISNKYSINGHLYDPGTVREKLRDIYLKTTPELFERISQKIDYSSIDIVRMVVLRSRDEFNVNILPEESLHLFINLHELNDIRRLNSYLISVNKRLITGGVFIGKVEPIKNRYKRFIKRYPTMIGRIFYFLDFIWRRAFPKIPVLQKFYFAITQGRNRALSFAESLGRLYYCGFKVIDAFEMDNFVYFMAVKSKESSTDSNPSYGPLFKMKRIGKNGKEIFVYKVRTMHPYSEYLQKFMFDNFGSESGDKVDKDFRVTSWGICFRRFWIDELPMLINWVKGDLKIVGIRPISLHKFNMYPREVREYRKTFKPGLVPPFYADLPKSFEELIESELRYLKSYEKKPISTDVRYFFKAFYNIVVKKARSK